MQGCLRALVLLCCLVLPGVVLAQEAIEDFAVTLQVEPDGNLLVTERISVNAEGQDIRRGIYRDLPFSYSLALGLRQNSPVRLLGVSRDGRAENVRTERNGAWVRYYLGSADVLLAPGVHSYELRYRVERALLHHPGSDELYWNVTGNDWKFPIRHASVEVLLPGGAQIAQQTAYTGARGAQGKDWQLTAQRSDGLKLVTTAELPEGHGLTVAVAWQAGLVARPGALARAWLMVLDNPGVGIGVPLLIGLFLFYLGAWRRVGRDPQMGVIIPLFEPPQGLNAVQAGYLWRRGSYAGEQAFSVWLTEMAIGKHLRLEDRPRSSGFNLSLTKADSAELGELDREICGRLFPSGKSAEKLQIGKAYVPRLADAVAGLNSLLSEQSKAWFSNNRGIWGWGLFFSVVASLLVLTLGGTGPDWGLGVGGLMFSLGFSIPLLVFVPKMRQRNPLLCVLLVLMFGWPIPIGLMMIAAAVPFPALLLLMLYGLLAVVFYFLMPAPTVEGRRLLDALEGYRNYLQLAERDVLALAGDAPAMSIALYERHLPYAMALGVEERWSARFSEALASGVVEMPQRDYQPDWYQSRTSYSSPASMSGALAAGLVSATALATTPPQSSSSGGGGFSSSGGSSSSGSSGGGSSGGGGGGGGGGGW